MQMSNSYKSIIRGQQILLLREDRQLVTPLHSAAENGLLPRKIDRTFLNLEK